MRKKMTVADMEQELAPVLEAIAELQEDATVPRNIKAKLQIVAELLTEEKTERSIRDNKALDVIEEVSDDSNIQPYTRTQLWNIVSILETLAS